jgi:diguanylate cyclase (GGDEF)-like protein
MKFSPDSLTSNLYLSWYKQPIVWALILLLCLISLISYISYREVGSLQQQLTHAAETPIKKIQLLGSMVHYSRQRQVLLRDIVIVEDAFLRDEIIQKHQIQASRYARARNNLQKLLTNQRELGIFNQILDENQLSYQVQLDIIDHAVNQNSEAAFKLLRETLDPSREKIYPLMLQLRDVLIEQSSSTTTKSKLQASETNRQILQLYIISVILGSILFSLAYLIQRKYHQTLAWQASHDQLTSLINRYHFEYILEELINGKNSDKACTLMYIDLDQFKLINDTAGHHAGDELLRQVATLLSEKLGSNSILARLGGDEFAILAIDIKQGDVETLASDILKSLSTFHFVWTDHTFDISASIGLVFFANHQMSKEELFTAADLACHTAKEKGRNRFHTYTPSDTETRSRREEMHMATRIREAITHNKLELYHQPIVNSTNHSNIHSSEILLRYIENDGRATGPYKMILAAEKFGFANTLDEYVVEKVLQHMKATPANETIYNINLSGQSLESKRTLNHIINLIDKYDISPELICFEITETAAIIRFSDAQKFIHTLKSMGCVFALDDFGSGVSSFGHLDKLPVDFIKIDASFVQNLNSDESSRAIVLAIREVAHAFGIKVIAEGVENDMIHRQIAALNIDFEQGYGIAMPAPLSMKIA